MFALLKKYVKFFNDSDILLLLNGYDKNQLIKIICGYLVSKKGFDDMFDLDEEFDAGFEFVTPSFKGTLYLTFQYGTVIELYFYCSFNEKRNIVSGIQKEIDYKENQSGYFKLNNENRMIETFHNKYIRDFYIKSDLPDLIKSLRSVPYTPETCSLRFHRNRNDEEKVNLEIFPDGDKFSVDNIDEVLKMLMIEFGAIFIPYEDNL
jgi:hypothetical protein